MAIISIQYDEGNKQNLGYKSVLIDYGDDLKEKKLFNTGDFIKDWYDMRKFMIKTLHNSEQFFINSSTVDHFLMDGAPYDSAYLQTHDDGTPYLSYIFGEDEIEFFVPRGTKPTFDELKAMCE